MREAGNSYGIRQTEWDLAGRQGVFTAIFRSPNKDERFQRMMSADWRLRILCSAVALSRPVSDFANAMTLEMTYMDSSR